VYFLFYAPLSGAEAAVPKIAAALNQSPASIISAWLRSRWE
jgi:hypothetical protein